MLRKSLLWGACLFVLLPALPAAAVEVEQITITTAVVNREPVDSVVVYPLQDSTLYCFSRIIAADQPTMVSHVWYRNDQVVSRVELPVKSSAWRTWSAKRLIDGWEGAWRVDVLDADEQLLKSVEFQVR